MPVRHWLHTQCSGSGHQRLPGGRRANCDVATFDHGRVHRRTSKAILQPSCISAEIRVTQPTRSHIVPASSRIPTTFRRLSRPTIRVASLSWTLADFGEAVDDFTFVIKYEPGIAGFYDNRQNAYRRNEQLNDALNDANEAIRLAPTYCLLFVAEQTSTTTWASTILP